MSVKSEQLIVIVDTCLEKKMLLVLLIFLLFRILFVPFRYYKVVGFEVFSQRCLLKMVANFDTLFLFSSHRQKLNLILSAITYRVVCLCNGAEKWYYLGLEMPLIWYFWEKPAAADFLRWVLQHWRTTGYIVRTKLFQFWLRKIEK